MPKYDPVLGIFAPDIPWVPTPAHIMRRAAILDLIRARQPGRVLEIGCGVGALLYDLKSRGFHGKGVDTSKRALEIARHFHGGADNAFKIDEQITEDDKDEYDYLMAFEVLEHIQDDRGELSRWAQCLKKGGVLIGSVPAHRRRWGASDQWAGHVRRYDYQDLEKLLASTGFDLMDTHCYGFPLLNLLAPISNYMSRKKIRRREAIANDAGSADATAASGADRAMESKIFWLYSNVATKILFHVLIAVQKIFYKSNLGTGFIFVAWKK